MASSMTISSPILALIAGILSILSPCVLPILPIVLGTAASSHRQGPLALAAGLSISFVGIGLFLATAGHSIGLDADGLRYVAAALLVMVGVVLLFPRLQARLATAAGPIGNWADGKLATGRSTASLDNSGSVCSWVPYGAPASDPRSEPHRCSRHKERTSVRLRLRCSRSALERRFHSWPWGGFQGRRWCAGVLPCCRPAAV